MREEFLNEAQINQLMQTCETRFDELLKALLKETKDDVMSDVINDLYSLAEYTKVLHIQHMAILQELAKAAKIRDTPMVQRISKH